MLRLDADGSLFTFTGRLPEANVVEQLIDMVIKPLLAFSRAPDFDSLLDKPLHHKGRFVLASAKTVKHENQKDIELMQHGASLDLNDGIARIGADFVARHSLFGDFVNNLPVWMTCDIFAACGFLHGDVVMIDLSDGGDAVKTEDSLHSVTSFLPFLSRISIPSTS